MANHNNRLINKYPELVASEWDYEKNENDGIHVNTVTYGSGIKAWWKCDDCHGRYQMRVYDKTSGLGCPYCSSHRVLAGFNDFQSKYPELVESEWDWIKNNQNGLKPNEITYGSNINAWFICSDCNGHYETTIKNKIRGKSCPFCAGKRVLKGFNDLASQYPDLINEWDYVNNDKKGLKPDAITSHSSVKAWWKCNDCNGSYEMSISTKTYGCGCPFCAGNKVLKGFNDLQSCYPDSKGMVSAVEWEYNT